MTTPWWNKQGNEHNEQKHQYLGVTEGMKENSLSLKTHIQKRKHEADWLQQEKACLVVSRDEEESLSRLMWYTCPKYELKPPMEVSVVSLGRSNHHNNSIHLLRRTNSPENKQLWKENASSPSWMEVNSGKSIHYSLFNPFTLKYHIRTYIECMITNEKWFQLG